ncbi:MAG: MBL fold metallo-hydrolase, partial [Chloroflexi bacterium]|nr:MBL fold metallo-hydrolase [Chloroflexota bacterium]
MEITWYGRTSFALKGPHGLVVTDPLDASGSPPTADIVTLSQPPSPEVYAKLQVKSKALRGPGEYEISDVFVTAIRTYRDNQHGALRGPNTVYRFKIEGLAVCHLGALGHLLNNEQVSAIGDVDVLFVPVGGDSLTPEHASETIGALEPKVIVPVPMAAKAAESKPAVDALVKE